MEKALTSEEWGKHYNLEFVDRIESDIRSNNVSCWTKEMLTLTEVGEKCLEIGCGTGMTSLYLAMHGRNVCALDYSDEVISLVSELKKRLGCNMNVKKVDAKNSLPFEENEFDVIFQCGLLEHFEKNERIQLLKNWGKAGKRMISMIPNASSIAYRVGKQMMEKNGTWEYGLELPQYSLKDEFMQAGFDVKAEYTIGAEHALNFLPKRHYLRKAIQKWISENECDDLCGQGYLLVTVGDKKDEN